MWRVAVALGLGFARGNSARPASVGGDDCFLIEEMTVALGLIDASPSNPHAEELMIRCAEEVLPRLKKFQPWSPTEGNTR